MGISVYPAPATILGESTAVVGQVVPVNYSPEADLLLAILVELRILNLLTHDGFCSQENLDRLRSEPEFTTVP